MLTETNVYVLLHQTIENYIVCISLIRTWLKLDFCTGILNSKCTKNYWLVDRQTAIKLMENYF